MSLLIPLRTGSGLNNREHFRVTARRVKAEKDAVAWLLSQKARPPLPCAILLTRIAPSSGLDDDNLRGALKAVRDQVAEWMGVNDRDRKTVRYLYGQHRGEWGVRIEWMTPEAGAQLAMYSA